VNAQKSFRIRLVNTVAPSSPQAYEGGIEVGIDSVNQNFASLTTMTCRFLEIQTMRYCRAFLNCHRLSNVDLIHSTEMKAFPTQESLVGFQ
jgi:hypothetical protein